MKTLRERATEIVEELTYCDYRTSEGVEKAERIVSKALREVSRDTRHACAESVVSHTSKFKFSSPDSAYTLIDVDKAHAAVMNTEIK